MNLSVGQVGYRLPRDLNSSVPAAAVRFAAQLFAYKPTHIEGLDKRLSKAQSLLEGVVGQGEGHALMATPGSDTLVFTLEAANQGKGLTADSPIRLTYRFPEFTGEGARFDTQTPVSRDALHKGLQTGFWSWLHRFEPVMPYSPVRPKSAAVAKRLGEVIPPDVRQITAATVRKTLRQLVEPASPTPVMTA